MDIDILSIKSIRYNSDLKYEGNENLFQKQKDNIILTQSDDEILFDYHIYLKSMVSKIHPKMETYKSKSNITSINGLVSTVETKDIKIDINNFNNIIKRNVKNISYFAHNDMLEVPYDMNYDKVMCYNKKDEIVKHEEMEVFSNINPPDIVFKHIPEDIICSRIKDECKLLIDEKRNTYGVFKNVSMEELNLIPSMVYDIMYDIDKKEFNFDTSNFIKSNLICKDIAEYGLVNPVLVYIDDDKIYSYAASQIISCKYLGLKEIPVCFIKTDYIPKLYEPEVKIKPEITYQKIVEMLYPYYL